MRAEVGEEGLLIPRDVFERLGSEEVEIIEEPGRLLIVAGGEGGAAKPGEGDPILSLGEDPVDDPGGATDASVNHDRYLYG